MQVESEGVDLANLYDTFRLSSVKYPKITDDMSIPEYLCVVINRLYSICSDVVGVTPKTVYGSFDRVVIISATLLSGLCGGILILKQDELTDIIS